MRYGLDVEAPVEVNPARIIIVRVLATRSAVGNRLADFLRGIPSGSVGASWGHYK